MNNRKLVTLTIVAAVMVIWALIQANLSRPQAKTSSAGTDLIQGLEPSSIAAIIIGTGDNAVKLTRLGDVFVVAAKEDYPAETSCINKLITSCLDVKTLEIITSDPRNFPDLEVTEEKAKGVVKFLAQDGKLITGLVIGKTDTDAKVTYVRLVTANDVYTTKQAPQIQTSAMDYIDKEIVNVSQADVKRVTLAAPDGTFTLRAADANDTVTMEPTPPDKKLKEADAKSILGALSYFSFNDVKKESSFESGTLKFDHTFVCELNNSTIYTFDIAKTDDKTWLKCSAEYAADLTGVVQSKENLKDKEAKLLARDNAAAFSQKHKGWVYEIADYKASNLTKKMSDLLEEKQPPKPVAEPNSIAPKNTSAPSADAEQKPKTLQTPPEPNAASEKTPQQQPPLDSNTSAKTKQPE